MELILENEFLTVKPISKGAEITSIKDKKDDTEYIWYGESKYWGRHAPILFPIVGKVKNNEYRIDDTSYTLGQHGFARDFEFDVIERSKDKVLFRLSWSEDTLKLYPYKFELYVQYKLSGNNLEVSYIVRNVDSKDIHFSIGAHPGFNCPLEGNGLEPSCFEDYYFEFENKETADILCLNNSGLFERTTQPYMKDSNRINFSNTLFKNDALVFEGLKSKKISLKNTKNSKSITLGFTGFPYLGLWSKPTGAPFVCIEPWFGHADFEDFDGDFRDKEGVLRLGKGEEFSCKYTITISE